ncbi:hypothetical protein B0H21DRAFT_757747 [Amylocystis lapponica]|nr:hypothetical protein B0H21DRAFT_757747 [Amylocystis lapponica]
MRRAEDTADTLLTILCCLLRTMCSRCHDALVLVPRAAQTGFRPKFCHRREKYQYTSRPRGQAQNAIPINTSNKSLQVSRSPIQTRLMRSEGYWLRLFLSAVRMHSQTSCAWSASPPVTWTAHLRRGCIYAAGSRHIRARCRVS